MLNISLGRLKSQYKRKKNQIVYYSIKTNGEKEIVNLINKNNEISKKEIYNYCLELKNEN